MKTGLYFEKGYKGLMKEIYGNLLASGIHVCINEKCLCDSQSACGLDAIIFHPHYDNKSGCWDKIKEFVKSNPSVQFYMLANNICERPAFFGEIQNLHYATGKDFFDNPAKHLLQLNLSDKIK